MDLKSTIDRSINNALIFVAASLPAKAVFLYQSCKRVRRYRRQASSHKSSALLLRRINLIQHSVGREFGHHDAGGNTQQGITRATLQMIDQLMDHHID